MGIGDALPVLDFFGSMAGSAATAAGGAASLFGNQGRIDQSNAYLNSFYAPYRPEQTFGTGPGAITVRGSGGAGTDWQRYLADAAGQYSNGGTVDPTELSQLLTRTADEQYKTLLPEHKARWDRGMKYLEGAGAQEKKDINTAFNNQGAANTANLVARGMAGSSIMPSMNSGNERQRADAQGGLNERLRQQYLNTDAALSGDYLNAWQGLWGNKVNAASQGYDLRQNALNNVTQLQQGQYNAAQDDLFSRLNVIGGTAIPYPSQDRNVNLAMQSGLGSWPAPNYPRASSSDALWTGIGGGAAAGATTALVAAAV